MSREGGAPEQQRQLTVEMGDPIRGRSGLSPASIAQARLVRFLILLLLAEAVTLFAVWPGLALHLIILLWLVARSAAVQSPSEARLLALLVLAPLIRLLSLTVPLFRVPEPLWQGVVAAFVLLALLLAVRRLHLPAVLIGLRPGRLWLQVPLGGLGLGFGLLGYELLPPAARPRAVDEGMVLLVGGGLLLAAFSEELFFRGALQGVAWRVLGRATFVFSAALYAVLQIGHESVENVALALLSGAVYGYLALVGRSIVGVTIAHALSSLLMFIVLPRVASGDVLELALAGTAVGSVAALGLHLPRLRRSRPSDPWRRRHATWALEGAAMGWTQGVDAKSLPISVLEGQPELTTTPGGIIDLVIRTVPGAFCGIQVVHHTGPSRAMGLVPRVADASGSVSWSWLVGTRTEYGRYPIFVTCSKDGRIGRLTLNLSVVPGSVQPDELGTGIWEL